MFFLPLPLERTVKTLEEVNNKVDSAVTGLPNPELYIIVNSKSKTNKVAWQSLINICAQRIQSLFAGNFPTNFTISSGL